MRGVRACLTILAVAVSACASARAEDLRLGLQEATLRHGGPAETVVVEASRSPDRDTDYVLGTGDKLRVSVFNEEDLSGDFEIDASGYVRLPLIGQTKAAGLTAHALETNIEQALSEGYLIGPRVAVEITNYRPFYIIGQVNKPGQYPYVNGMTALNAVAMAGGYTSQAVESYIYVRHEGETREERVAVDRTAFVRPGDVVRVTDTTFWSVMSILSPLTALGRLAY